MCGSFYIVGGRAPAPSLPPCSSAPSVLVLTPTPCASARRHTARAASWRFSDLSRVFRPSGRLPEHAVSFLPNRTSRTVQRCELFFVSQKIGFGDAKTVAVCAGSILVYSGRCGEVRPTTVFRLFLLYRERVWERRVQRRAVFFSIAKTEVQPGVPFLFMYFRVFGCGVYRMYDD